jgi:hypothetical protein
MIETTVAIAQTYGLATCALTSVSVPIVDT